MSIVCLFLVLVFTGCKPEYRIKTVVEFEDKTDNLQAEKQATLDEVHDRIVADYGPTVTLTSNDGAIFWETPHTAQPVGEMAKLIAYFGSADLGVYELYKVGDEPLAALLDSFPFARYGAMANPSLYAPATIATLTDKRQLPDLLAALNQDPHRPAGVRFAAQVPDRFRNVDKMPIQLYALRGKASSGEPLLTNDVITETDVVPNEEGEILVTMTMNEAGAREWGRITTEAFNADKRQVAIVLNGEVFAAPSVSSPITGGKAALYGNLSVEGAEHLAKQLLWEPLTLPLRIVSQDVVE